MSQTVKNLQVACIAALFFGCLINNIAQADFVCASDISYTWTSSSAAKASTPTASGANSTTPAANPVATSAPNQTFVGKIEARAESEDLAKKALDARSAAAKTQAITRCKREHENMSGCVAAKYSAMGTTLNTLTFSARKALEDAIRTDCELQRGVCGEATVAQAQCGEEVKAVEPTPEAAKGADKKGEKKK